MGPNTVVLWDPGPDRSQRGRGPYRGAVSSGPGHNHSARVRVKARHPLLMEWAGAGSLFSLRTAPLAPGGEAETGRKPNHCVPTRATSDTGG